MGLPADADFCPAQPLYSPSESVACSDLAMDPYFPLGYQSADTLHADDTLQSYFDPPVSDDDFASSPAANALDGSTYIEPSLLNWTQSSSNFAVPPGYDFGRNLSLSTGACGTPDLCEDGEYFLSNESLPQTPADDHALPHMLKRASPEAKPEQPVKRKRGRPRIIRADSDSTDSKRKSRESNRLPHNQVERKYREGLNAELERLRLAVPTLPQWDAHALDAPPKPSKATVLASAIEYIRKMELERDQLRQENEVLRTGKRVPRAAALNAGFRGCTWEPVQAIID